MHLEGKYLLVSYRDLPGADFICDQEGNLRIKVSMVKRSALKLIPQKFLPDIASEWILVVENISNQLLKEQEEILKAVNWYKSKLGLNAPSCIYL